MPTRRSFLIHGAALTAAALSSIAPATPARRLLLVHGRSQQGKNPEVLKATWLEALRNGARAAGTMLPADTKVAFPFYGDALEELTRRADLPLTSDVQARGEGAVDQEFLRFQAEVADALRVKRGITDQQVDREYGNNPRPKGPLNWEWVQAILRALDRHGGGINRVTLEQFTRDVFLYTRRSLVRETIDRIVADVLTEEPTVVVGHSLGSVVAYSVLRYDARRLDVPLFATVGSPLGVRAIRDRFKPLDRPRVGQWFNAYDDRDVVALYALDGQNFPVDPAVENYSGVDNPTGNRHGIAGYLDDARVAGVILNHLAA